MVMNMLAIKAISASFATDMLLAGGQSQNESALAPAIYGLARQPPRHLPNILLTSGNDSAVRTSESKRHAERLRLHGHDVGLPRGLHNPQGHCLGNGNDQQDIMFVGDFGDSGHILNGAEEVGRLYQYAGSLRDNRRFQLLQVDAAVFLEPDLPDRHTLMMCVCREYFSVFGVDAASHRDRTPAGQSYRHQYRFGRCR